MKTYTADEIRLIRKRCRLTQGEFWGVLGITQSGGSRYESGRDIPTPVQLLLNIALATRAKSAEVVEDLRAGCSEKAVS